MLTDATIRIRHRCLDIVVTMAVFFTAFGLGALTHNRGLVLADDGNIVLAAHRVLQGQIPFVDFRHYFYSPGRIYVLAVLFDLFGERYLVSRWMWVVVRSISAVLVFLVARRYVPRSAALLPAAVVTLVPGPWFKSFFSLCALLPLYCNLLYNRRPSFIRLMVLGASTAFALFFRQDMGLVALVVAAITILHTHLFCYKRAPRRCLVHLAVWFSAVTILLSPFLFYMHYQNALIPMVKQLFVETPAFTASKAQLTFTRMQQLFSKNLLAFVMLLGPAITVAGGVIILFRRAFPSNSRFQLFLLIAVSTLSLVPAHIAFAPVRIFQSHHVVWILYIVLVHHLLTHNRLVENILGSVDSHGEIKKRLLMGLIPLLFCVGFFALKDRLVHPCDPLTPLGLPFQLKLRGETVYVSWREGAWITFLQRFIEESTAPEEPVVFLPTYSLLNYACNRPNPTRYINLWTQIYEDSEHGRVVERHLIEELRAARVRFVFRVRFKKIGKELHDFLKKEYLELFYIGPLAVLQKRSTLKVRSP